ncbi:ribonuclease III [Sphingosinicella sp. CPCC 101087]|uniref:ribonuclease III n=1 Tax=Sphingosinicella sp. CPCC 101087 TaxID=2497754 RepID=UPI00101D9ACC|nr:ribonuclease III [Sphingosinicella sp. CPCC 101087]
MLAQWLEDRTGHRPKDLALFELAMTHSSKSERNYERLEFLGDRVLGLATAAQLYALFPEEPEGKLSRRLNVLVSRATCAQVGRDIGVPTQMRLGKQAREDGAHDSDNILGDTVEALIGAIFLDAGFTAAEKVVQRLWVAYVGELERAPKHPKSELQEWAAANDRRPPVYALVGRSGPHHSPRFVVEVSIPGAGDARGEGTTKQEAETAAAETLLEQVKSK